MLAATPIADAPPTVIRPFHGPADTVREMIRAIVGPRGEQSTLVRGVKDHIIREIQPKDYLSEILAVRFYVHEHCKYSNDALGVEQVQDPERLCDQIIKYGKAVADCFEQGTLVLKKGHVLAPVESLSVGDKIWGLNEWVEVEGVVFKGIQEITSVLLNNGSSLRLTADHHVYVAECPRHGNRTPGSECSCPQDERREVRMRVSELQAGMALVTPKRLPFGEGDLDPDRALVEGLFVADGWVGLKSHRSHNINEFSISGQDGCPKEEQKRIVKEIAERYGYETRWHRKSIAVKDHDWALRMQQMGHLARNKHLLSLNLDEAAAAATLRGVMADSGKNTNGPGRTFTTSSRELWAQVRVLHKMFGVTCGFRYIENHGGLGQHPIWRLNTRSRSEETTDGRTEKTLRIKRIDHEVAEAPVWDIQTTDHHVYLPEHDVTVSQCDDISTLMGCLCRQLGRETEIVIVGFGRQGSYSHVFVRVKEPKSGTWIVLDPVAGTDEASMLRRVTTHQIWKLP
jgi:hypothetical protein